MVGDSIFSAENAHSSMDRRQLVTVISMVVPALDIVQRRLPIICSYHSKPTARVAMRAFLWSGPGPAPEPTHYSETYLRKLRMYLP